MYQSVRSDDLDLEDSVRNEILFGRTLVRIFCLRAVDHLEAVRVEQLVERVRPHH